MERKGRGLGAVGHRSNAVDRTRESTRATPCKETRRPFHISSYRSYRYRRKPRSSRRILPVESFLPPPPPGRTGWPWTYEPAARSVHERPLPRISVVTPSFNQGCFLEEAIRSVLLQGYPELEYVVIDGGSRDRTLEVIRRYERWITAWVSEPDDGQADAINKGFARCTGEVLAWVNSDDVLWPGHLVEMGRLFASMASVDLAYRDVLLGPEPDRITEIQKGEPTSFLEMVATGNIPIPQQSAMWRRNLFLSLGGLDPRWHVLLDRDFFLRAAETSRLRYHPGIGGFFRQHPDAKSTAEIGSWEHELPQYYQEFFARRSHRPEVQEVRRRGMAHIYLTCSVIARRLHHPLRAIAWLTLASTRDPVLVAGRLWAKARMLRRSIAAW